MCSVKNNRNKNLQIDKIVQQSFFIMIITRFDLAAPNHIIRCEQCVAYENSVKFAVVWFCKVCSLLTTCYNFLINFFLFVPRHTSMSASTSSLRIHFPSLVYLFNCPTFRLVSRANFCFNVQSLGEQSKMATVNARLVSLLTYQFIWWVEIRVSLPSLVSCCAPRRQSDTHHFMFFNWTNWELVEIINNLWIPPNVGLSWGWW